MRATALLVALTAAAGLLAPAGVGAHQIGPNYETVVRSVTPQTPGLDVTVLKSVGQLQLVNKSGKTVVVYGYDGDPYVRLDADGKVYLNSRSPAKYLNTDIYADVDVPKYASSKAKPVWVLDATDSTFAWHDHRIHWMSPEPPRSVADLNRKQKIFDWKVPITVAGDRGAIAGTLYWAGEPKAPPLGSILVFGISAIVVIVGGFIWYRRMGDYDDDGESPDTAAEPEKEAW